MKFGLMVVVLCWFAYIATSSINANQRMITDLAVKCEIAGGRLLRFNDALLGNAVGCFTGLTQIDVN